MKNMLFGFILLFASCSQSTHHNTKATEETTAQLEKKLFKYVALLDSVNNSNIFDSDSGAALFSNYIDSIEYILSQENAAQINFKQLKSITYRANVLYAFQYKLRVFVWNESWEGVFENSSVSLFSVLKNNKIQHSWQEYNNYVISGFHSLNDSLHLMTSYGRSARDCYFDYYNVVKIKSDSLITQEENNITFSYSMGDSEQFNKYDTTDKTIRFAKRPCYYWNLVETEEEIKNFPLLKGVFKFNRNQFELVEGEFYEE